MPMLPEAWPPPQLTSVSAPVVSAADLRKSRRSLSAMGWCP
jgi:hypothetical protein